MKLWRVEHFHNIFVFTFGRDCYCIQQSHPKVKTKVFNPPEFLFSEVTFFQNWYFSWQKVAFFSHSKVCTTFLSWTAFSIYTIVKGYLASIEYYFVFLLRPCAWFSFVPSRWIFASFYVRWNLVFYWSLWCTFYYSQSRHEHRFERCGW